MTFTLNCTANSRRLKRRCVSYVGALRFHGTRSRMSRPVRVGQHAVASTCFTSLTWVRMVAGESCDEAKHSRFQKTEWYGMKHLIHQRPNHAMAAIHARRP